MTFPESERLSPSGLEQAERDRITRRWETAFAAKVCNEQANTSTPAGIADFEIHCGKLTPRCRNQPVPGRTSDVGEIQ